MDAKKPIFVTRPTLPPRDVFQGYIDEIWDSRFLTNMGPIHQRLEAALQEYLDVPYITLVANATLGLALCLRHLGCSGEVITPAFSFVATTHAIRWAGAEPVFADINPLTMKLDPAALEGQITEQTSVILPVHCFGQACDTDAIEKIGQKYGIPVVYDAAHCFGAVDDGGSLLRYGDLSVVSFHATKVFSTFEGGAIVSHDAETKQKLDQLCNYGIVDESNVDYLGLNAKMSEIHAAFGLSRLPFVSDDIANRKNISTRYYNRLGNTSGITFACPADIPGHNYYAFPIIIEPEYPLSRDALYERMKENGIHARRYFYPSLADLPMYRDLPSARPENLPNVRETCDRVLCLPLYPDLPQADQDRVIDVVLSAWA